MSAAKNSKATFIYINQHSFENVGDAIIRKVTSRDIKAQKLPNDTKSFHFFDAPAHLRDDDALDNCSNASPRYRFAKRVISRKEALALFKPNNLFINGKHYIGKLEKARVYLIDDLNGIRPIQKRDVVLDATRKQLWPRIKAAPDFNVVAKTRIPLMRKITLVRKPTP